MNQTLIAEKLRALRNKRGFCARHGLGRRTLYRLIDGGNPTVATLRAFDAALKSDARKASAAA